MHSTSVRHQAGAPDTGRRHTLHRIAAGAATLAAPVLAHAQARSTSAQGDILVGRSSALSGPMAPFLAPIHAGQDAAIADFNATLGTDFSDEECHTVGGLILNHLRRVPARNEIIELEGVRFQVLRADSRRLYTLFATPIQNTDAAA